MVLHKNLATDHLHDPKDHTHLEVDITDLDAYLTEADADALYSLLAHDHVIADVTDFDPADYLPLTAGSGEPLTGNLHLEKVACSIYLNSGGVTDSFMLLSDNASVGAIYKKTPSGTAILNINPLPADGTSDAILSFFNASGTTGGRKLRLWGGGSVQHEFNAGTGDVDLCQQGGALSVGDVIDFDYGTAGTGSLQADGATFLSANPVFTVLGRAAQDTLIAGGFVRLDVDSSAPDDGDLDSNSAIFYLDESGNNLKVKLKYAGGTVKTGTVAALT